MTELSHSDTVALVAGNTAVSGGRLTGRGMHYEATGESVAVGDGSVAVSMKLNEASVDKAASRAGVVSPFSRKHLKQSSALTDVYKKNQQGWHNYNAMLSKTGPWHNKFMTRQMGALRKTLDAAKQQQMTLSRQMGGLAKNRTVKINAENLPEPVKSAQLKRAVEQGKENTETGLNVRQALQKKAAQSNGLRQAREKWRKSGLLMEDGSDPTFTY